MCGKGKGSQEDAYSVLSNMDGSARITLSITYLFHVCVKSNSRLMANICSRGELKSAENLKLWIDVPAGQWQSNMNQLRWCSQLTSSISVL